MNDRLPGHRAVAHHAIRACLLGEAAHVPGVFAIAVVRLMIGHGTAGPTSGASRLQPRAAVIADGRGGDDGEHSGDERRRRPGGELPDVGEQQLDRDGRKDEGQPWLQVAEPGGRPGEQEVQCPHAE
jgi:hypothetical protein